jgi:hypothetical protein
MGANKRSEFSRIIVNMLYMVYVAIIWTPVKGGLHGKSQGGHYFIYKNLDLETGSNRWFGNYIKFGEQESLIIFSGCDYPAGLQQDYIVRLPLDRFGIENFYLTVRFRPTEATW